MLRAKTRVLKCNDCATRRNWEKSDGVEKLPDFFRNRVAISMVYILFEQELQHILLLSR